MSATNRPWSAMLVVCLVVGSALVAGVGTTAAVGPSSDDADGGSTPTPTTDADDGFDLDEDADEVYVKDNGDVVLVYQDSTEDDEARGEFGLSVSQSVFHALVASDRTDHSSVTGSLSGMLEPDSLSASGGLKAPRPDEIESLSFQLEGEQSDENARMDASLAATVTDPDVSSLVSSATASGEMTVSPDRFHADGSFHADTEQPLGEQTSSSYSIRETGDQYVVDVERDTEISSYFAERWNTSENARQTLEMQYGSIAEALGGSASIDIQSYSFTDEGTDQWTAGRLAISFSVTYTGIDAGLEDQIASTLESSEEYDLSADEAEAVGEAVADVSVEEISASYAVSDAGIDSSFTASISNYYPALRESVSLLNELSLESDETTQQLREQLEDAEKRLAAWRASDLQQSYEFDMTVDGTAESALSVDSSLAYRTENWNAYRSELASRGLTSPSSTVSMTAETSGDSVTFNGSVEVEQEDLVADWVEDTNGSLSLEPSQERLVDALREGEFRKARFDARMTDESVVFEAGAAFENMSVLRDALAETEGEFDLNVASAVGDTENGESEVYVLAKDAVSPDASESEVRELDQVGEDTTVHLPGEYDRSFPDPDVAGAYEYLDLPVPATSTPTPNASTLGSENETTTGETPTGSTATDVPGFGVTTAVFVLAVLSMALFVRRRSH